MNIKDFLVYSGTSLRDALKQIDRNHKGIILVCNKNDEIKGLSTDGDIRRQLLINDDINQIIDNCMNKDFVFAKENSSHEEIYKLMDNEIKAIPVLDNNMKLKSIFTIDNLPLRDEGLISARAKSPVRISFGGGGSDTTAFFSTNNGAVINSTISLYCYASLFKRNDSKITIDSLDIDKKITIDNISFLDELDDDFGLIKSVIKTIKPDFGFDLNINSDFPRGSGLGGSSAVCASIIGCFNEFRIDKWNSYEISEIAYESERLQLNIAGGWQDQYATVFGGFNFMEFSESKNLIHPLRIKKETLLELENNIILCYTQTNHTDDNIHRTQKSNTSNQKIIDNIKANVKLCYETRDCLLKGDLMSFGETLNKTWKLKKTFAKEISNAYLDDIYDNAVKNGASGGKLLGAGGGGYFVFYVRSEKKNNFLRWAHAQDIICTSFKFVEDGLSSWITRN
jgi:D-glycero-alpha-D-manno-heptose-7-phosphate kinase|tara:strand:- start:3874 stop:5232 length:1359 start_codon:yes stop_codon:yes gene_type:complete